MGFGQEMKDFLSAYQAGEKIVGAKDDREYKQAMTKYQLALAQKQEDENNDEEGDKLDKDAKRASIALARSRAGSEVAYQNNLNRPQPDPNAPMYSGAIPPRQPNRPAPVIISSGQPAVPAAPAVGGTVPPMDPSLAMSSGGPVKKYAAGGAVSNDGPDEEDDGDDDDAVAPTPAVGGPRTSNPMDAMAAMPPRGFSGAASADAVHAARTYATHVGSRSHPAAHAAPVEDIEKIKDAVDPNHQMSDSERNLAAVGAVYQYKMSKNDTVGAARAAYQMLAHYHQASQKYAVLAAAAAEKGNLDVAAHAAMKAYANVPDGKEFKVVKTPDGKLAYTFTDSATGKVIQQGIETPEKLAATSMGFAQDGFGKALNEAAGLPPPKEPKAAVGPKSLKVSDKSKLLDQIDEAYKTQNPDVPDPNDSKKSNPKYAPDDQTMHKGAAFRMVSHPNNSTMTPDEATQVATKIADPSIPDKGGFSPKKVDGGYEVTFGKRKSFVPEDDFDSLMAKRMEIDATNKAKKEKADEDGKKPGWGSTIADGVSAVGGFVKKKVDESIARGDERRAKAAEEEKRNPAVPSEPAPANPY